MERAGPSQAAAAASSRKPEAAAAVPSLGGRHAAGAKVTVAAAIAAEVASAADRDVPRPRRSRVWSSSRRRPAQSGPRP